MGDDQLMPTIEGVMKEAEWKYEDLTHIAVVNGPGGFTSLRMAVTLANVLADQLGIPATGIHLSDVYAARVSADDFLWVHSTKKIELFVRGFGSFAELWPEPTLVSIDDFVAKVPSNAMWAGELIADHRVALVGKNLLPADLKSLEGVLPAFLASLAYKKELILPWYGRGW
jgi:tRNA threonylcarbamoyl adenosine modification protein YeaZ